MKKSWLKAAVHPLIFAAGTAIGYNANKNSDEVQSLIVYLDTNKCDINITNPEEIGATAEMHMFGNLNEPIGTKITFPSGEVPILVAY